MKPFVVNSHGRLVFPSNFFPELDFSAFETLDQLQAVIRRDFDAKAPGEAVLLERVEGGGYFGRYDLLRDLALHLLWADRYALAMFERRPTRWRDVPRDRDDLFLALRTPWNESERTLAAVEAAYDRLPPTWDAAVEDSIFRTLRDVLRHKRYDGTAVSPIAPTVAELGRDPDNVTECLAAYDPSFPVFGYERILDCHQEVPELEALHRQAMVLHDEHPWDRSHSRLARVGELGDDDFVIVLTPRTREVLDFVRRVNAPRTPRPVATPPPAPSTNADVVRNSAANWSPMPADTIKDKTGIEERRYTERSLEELALGAARAALDKADRGPEEIGAVVFCSCTNTQLMPSVATWLSGQLGMFQTHASLDLVAACAGFPYGLAEGIRLLQEVERPVLVVFGEKFSDKIGRVRTSRMLFGDGAAAVVLAPAPPGVAPDIEVVQTYASGPASEVNSIIWPNPEFDNDMTVYGPEVKALVKRYLEQMMAEVDSLGLLDEIELGIPHQANKNMVIDLAGAAGLEPERLYFNIATVGNVSAASIPIAIHDSVLEGVIERPTKVFAPGFGAGAVGGYAVLRVDPAIVALEQIPRRRRLSLRGARRRLSLRGRLKQAA
jgi:3-oxoacyl-[acyl-carrier-protein] synthase III